MRRFHVLVVIHGYPPAYNAGSEVYSQSVCNELSIANKVSVFTREENVYAPDFAIRSEMRETGVAVYYCNNPHGKDGYRHKTMDLRFSRLIDELQPDVAYIGHLNHLSTGLVDVLKRHGVPIVYMLHDYWLMCPRGQFLTRSIGKPACDFEVCDGQDDEKCACNCHEVYFSGCDDERRGDIDAWSRWIHRRMSETKTIAEKVDRFIAPSRYLYNRFVHDFRIPESKIVYLDYGFPSYLNPAPKNPAKKKYTFGYIGTHIPAKGVNLLIEAFQRIDEDCGLKIFGRMNPHSQALQRMASSDNGALEFCGGYANDELATKVFANVDAIVVPSIWAENSPLVIHEAQACRVPVITADFGGMAEYVKHGVNGLLFRHRDADSLAECMRWAVRHKSEMAIFGKRGYLYADDGHVTGIAEHCNKLMEIFRDLQK